MRREARLAAIAVLCGAAGCTLDLERLRGTPTDTGPRDAPRLDAPGLDAPGLDAPRLDGDILDAPTDLRDVGPPGPVDLVLLGSVPNGAGSLDAISAGRDATRAVAAMTSRGAGTIRAFSLDITGCAVGSVGTLDLGAPLAGPVLVDDLDRDGSVDVLVGHDDSRLSFHAGSTGGGFDSPTTITTGLGPLVSVATASVDADGETDVVLFEFGPRIRFFPVAGRAFGAASGPSGSGITYFDGAVADLDGSGTADLIAIESGVETSLTFVPGSGDGTFDRPSSAMLLPTVRRLAVGVLVAGAPATAVCVGNSDTFFVDVSRAGTFTVEQRIGLGTDMRDVVMAELDGVPPLEFVLAAAGDSALRVYRMVTGTPTELLNVAVTGTPVALAAVDIDADGRDEVLVLFADRFDVYGRTCP